MSLFKQDDENIKKERRAYPRVNTHNLLREMTMTAPVSQRVTNMINLSRTGLQYVSDEPKAPGSVIKMVISIAEKETEIPVLGKVVWSRKNRLTYRTGIHFISMAENHWNLLGNYVEETLVTKPQLAA